MSDVEVIRLRCCLYRASELPEYNASGTERNGIPQYRSSRGFYVRTDPEVFSTPRGIGMVTCSYCFTPFTLCEQINLFVDSFFSTNIALLGSNMAVYVPQHAVEYSNVSFCDATVDARQSCRVFHPNCDLCVGNSNGVASSESQALFV